MLNSKTLISIIVPVYNVEEYLERCVNSLVNQDYKNIEILLVDDGSTDSSGKLCDALAEKDNRITVFHKPNGGLSDARNYGLKRAKGEYAFFIDSDDYIVENACSYMLNDAEKNNADLVIGHAKMLKVMNQLQKWENFIGENFEYHHVYTGKQYLQECLEKSDVRIEAWRSLYKVSFLKDNNLYFKMGIAHEDELFTPITLLAAQRVVLSDLEFYVYDNDRPTSIMNSQSMNSKKAFDRLYILETLYPIYKAVSPKKLRKLLLDNICWKYLETVSIYKLYNNKEFKPKRLETLRNAYTLKRKVKSLIFFVSPKLYGKLM